MIDSVINCGGPPHCGTCRRCREAAALDRVEPFPVRPAHPVPGFSQYDKPRRRGESYRSRQIDALLGQLGIGRRPRHR
jgi:hypothetical protein